MHSGTGGRSDSERVNSPSSPSWDIAGIRLFPPHPALSGHVFRTLPPGHRAPPAIRTTTGEHRAAPTAAGARHRQRPGRADRGDPARIRDSARRPAANQWLTFILPEQSAATAGSHWSKTRSSIKYSCRHSG